MSRRVDSANSFGAKANPMLVYDILATSLVLAFDHGPMVTHASTRLVAKMSYTNIGFALAPKEFALSSLRDIYGAALGYQVDATNLQRVLARRGVITQTGTVAQSGRSGGRPAALYHFTDSQLRVTDEFAAFRPPGQL